MTTLLRPPPAAAFLIAHHSWLAAHGTPSNEPSELPLKACHMARGSRSLFVPMAPNMRSSGLLWFPNKVPEKEVEHDHCRDDFLQSPAHLNMIFLTLDSIDVDVSD